MTGLGVPESGRSDETTVEVAAAETEKWRIWGWFLPSSKGAAWGAPEGGGEAI